MGDVLTNLRAHCEDGAKALWLVGDRAPYGVYIDTPKLIGLFAAEVGFTVREDITLRARGQRWANLNDRHTIPLSERLPIIQAT